MSGAATVIISALVAYPVLRLAVGASDALGRLAQARAASNAIKPPPPPPPPPRMAAPAPPSTPPRIESHGRSRGAAPLYTRSYESFRLEGHTRRLELDEITGPVIEVES